MKKRLKKLKNVALKLLKKTKGQEVSLLNTALLIATLCQISATQKLMYQYCQALANFMVMLLTGQAPNL